jgi:CubicO group peptidase (beta-lactamase class C family)
MIRAAPMRRVPPPVSILVLLISPAAVTGGTGGDDPARADGRFAAIAQATRQFIDEHGQPSVAVAVAKSGRIVWEDALGWADRERRIPATPHTPYSLASISKPFTATAVMKLVEDRRISLDAQANSYLGAARIAGPRADKATVRRVLSHTAGLPPFFRPFFGTAATPIEEIIGLYALLRTPPGKRHVYSNLGYGILDHIIGRVSGLTYEEFMRREIFAPLRLESASVPLVAPAHAAVRYDDNDRPLPFYDVGHRGASAVYASAHDLARFGMFHLKERVDGSTPLLAHASIEEMQRLQTPGSSTAGYGLGWRIDDTRPGLRQVGHTGGMPGVTTVLSLYPTERLVIVVLTNKRNDKVVPLANEIAARVLPHYAWRLRGVRTHP